MYFFGDFGRSRIDFLWPFTAHRKKFLYTFNSYRWRKRRMKLNEANGGWGVVKKWFANRCFCLSFLFAKINDVWTAVQAEKTEKSSSQNEREKENNIKTCFRLCLRAKKLPLRNAQGFALTLPKLFYKRDSWKFLLIDVFPSPPFSRFLPSFLFFALSHTLSLFLSNFHFRSLPKLSSQDDDGADSKKKEVPQFEPIPHDHNFCERVVINVCRSFAINPPPCSMSFDF